MTTLYVLVGVMVILATHELFIGKKNMKQMIEQGMVVELVQALAIFLIAGLLAG